MDPITSIGSAGSAAAPSEAKLRQVAKQFEAIFLQELFKGLEKPPDAEPGLFDDSQASSTFDQLHHQELAERSAGGMGIADLLIRGLVTRGAAVPPKPAVAAAEPPPPTVSE